MKSLDGIELTNFLNPNLTWKRVTKGRSTMRRTRKSVARSEMTDVVAADKSAREVVESQGVSESEKLGVAVLGQHFAGKVDHVPIKKRRFMCRSSSQSPSKKTSSSRRKVPEHIVQISHVSHVSKLRAGVIDGKPLDVSSEKPCCNGHDFYGIEILADVACKSYMGDDILPAVQNRSVEESVQQQKLVMSSVPAEGINSSARTIITPQNDGVHEDETGTVASQTHSVSLSDKSSADESTGEAARDEIENTVPLNNSVAVLDNSLVVGHNGMTVETETEKIACQNSYITVLAKSSAAEPGIPTGDGETKSIVCQNNFASVSDKSSADECNGKLENTACSRDDRLLWDLNLSVDAWEQPCDPEDDGSRRNVVGEVPVDVHTQKQCTDINNDRVDGVTESDGHGNMSAVPSEFNSDTIVQCAKEFQSGYDSQIEDGELRESYPCWEENDGDAGEIEHVDYDSDPEDERFDSLSETNEKEMDNVCKGHVSELGNAPRQSESGPSGDASRTRRTETNDGSDVEKHVVVCLNDSDLQGSSKGFVSKPFKRDFPSRDAIQRRRSNIYGDSHDRDVGSDKFMGRNRSVLHARFRSPGRGPFGYCDSSKRRYSPIYSNVSYNFNRPRPKNAVEGRGFMNGSDHTSGTDSHIRRQFSNGAYRNRFRRYPEGVNRDFRGNDRSMPNDSNEYPPGGRLQQRMANRRERSNSPMLRRLHYPQTYRKSRSRSRSRSPIAWNNKNRSPNLRFDRVRLPFQRRFPVDNEMGFVSPPRNRGSPQRNPRWFEDRGGDDNKTNNYKLRRKSPVRTLRPRQRFDSGEPMRRVNSENRFRPMMRHRRFPDGGGAGRGRGCKYEGNDEGKSGKKYEMFNRVRRYDDFADGDNIRRFRFNGEGSLVTNDS